MISLSPLEDPSIAFFLAPRAAPLARSSLWPFFWPRFLSTLFLLRPSPPPPHLPLATVPRNKSERMPRMIYGNGELMKRTDPEPLRIGGRDRRRLDRQLGWWIIPNGFCVPLLWRGFFFFSFYFFKYFQYAIDSNGMASRVIVYDSGYSFEVRKWKRCERGGGKEEWTSVEMRMIFLIFSSIFLEILWLNICNNKHREFVFEVREWEGNEFFIAYCGWLRRKI